MTEAPKIVYDRLQAARPQRDLPHPDADLLTAFAEQALSATERSSVLNHLALCGDCRQVIALALSPENIAPVTTQVDIEPVAATVPAKSKLLNWPTLAWPGLRWAALAAGIALAASILLLHPGRLNQQTPVANRQVAPPAPALTAAPPQSASSIPPSPLDRSSLEQPAHEPSATLAKSQLARLQAGRPTQPPASRSQQSDMLLADNRMGSSVEEKTQAAPAPPSPNLDAGKSAPQAANETVEVSGATALVETESSNLISLAQHNAPAIEKAKQAPPETEASEQPTSRTAYDLDTLKLQGRNVVSAAKLARSPNQTASSDVTWMVAAGVLQRSRDNGQTWQNVLRADHALLCYASRNADIWTGGRAGTLYHSSDNGLTWVQVRPTVKAGALSSDIIHIDIQDHERAPSEIVISTGNSEVWNSIDGGKTWDKK